MTILDLLMALVITAICALYCRNFYEYYFFTSILIKVLSGTDINFWIGLPFVVYFTGFVEFVILKIIQDEIDEFKRLSQIDDLI